ncbi:uncharacterized protein N7479_005028 [Penicillium vulpinum]|uniref:Protein TsetseEP domain-containing protein n=1 Tax=Penicillium vulpinum TaxID=29845 RepID=A0A1V6RMH8_9EURO|nr:uncharacterized protein N7479_005028 [Penicillium vulpinum]KAJ5965152.1 hypothetical protein N7479_005028 [Penicillium vulpinum]OQE03011.1 hypothetical protein PENVUL_c036G05078 [Penicillium vulpinum]
MKLFMTISSVLTCIGFAVCQTQTVCTADDVINSITAVERYAQKMQSVTDSSNENIDPAAAIYKNFEGQTRHLNEDLQQCTFNTTADEQTQICSAYEEFATAQLGYLHVADGRDFYAQNGHGENAVKMHGYILQAQNALVNYTAQVGEAATSCADRVNTAYAPLGTQLQNLLEAYPGTA